MESYKAYMVIGKVLMIIGMFMASVIFFGYSLSEVLGYYAVVIAILFAGWRLAKKGEQLRDGR